MRVVHVINCLSTGGAERQLLRLAAAQRRHGDDAVILTLLTENAFAEQEEFRGVPVTALGLRGMLDLPRVIRRLRHSIEELAPDVVQSWLYWANLAALVAAGRSPARRRWPIAWNIRQTVPDLSHERLAMRMAFRLGARWSGRIDGLVYNAQAGLDQHRRAGYRAPREVVIPNAIDVDAAPRGAEARRAARRTLELDDTSFVLVHSARLHPMKDHASMLEAVAPLLEARHGLIVLLFGRGVRADAFEEVIARHPGLRAAIDRRRLRFMDEHRDFLSLLPAADLLVSSSAWGEGVPNVVAEAMAAEIPVVATDVGDGAALVGDGGRIVSARDAGALRAAITTMIDAPSAERAAIGRRGHARVRERYTIDSAIEAYHRLWESIRRSGAR